MMLAEFHGVDFACTPSDIIPSGSNYTDLAYRTCNYAGSQIGSPYVNGDSYLAVQYGFTYDHVWRNFGILILFTVVYIAATCWLSEIMEWETDGSGALQYKKSRKQSAKACKPSKDEESGADQGPTTPSTVGSGTGSQALTGTKSTFSWDNLELFVQIGKEQRKLLDGVSGHCKPGTLTALVGASGAGKSTCKFLHPLILDFG